MRKRSEFQSSHPIQHLHVRCQGGHKHLTLRGGGLPAASARYPEGECNRILSECLNPATIPEGGRIMPPTSTHTFSRSQSLEESLYELRELAYQTNHRKDWDFIVKPWLVRQKIVIRKRERKNCSQKEAASDASGKVAHHLHRTCRTG